MAKKATAKMPPTRNTRSVTKDDVQIGLRIRMRRVDMKLSQNELGEKLGVTFQQVQKYEKGVNRISGNRMRKLCEELQVDPNYLLGWNGKTTKLEETYALDTLNYKTASIISELPDKLRNPIHALARQLAEVAKDLK